MLRSAMPLAIFASALAAAPTDKPVTAPAPPVPAGYQQVTIGKHTFTLPVGFTIQLVAESPQVDRPVTAAFDDQGRLYVADSSGSNARPTDQLKDPTHRVVRLETTKKDGKFDKSTVFADKLSFLQGTMWRDGSLYVATPPTIQKLTDTDGDGTADKREVWFDGKVLTGCANDVHGPYPGPDGRVYFTKGAFAKQELTLGNGQKFVTRAAHIYSAKPDGSDIRVEMTGGMDNPVDVAFNTAGELFFTTTFLQHPANGRRDGLIHRTYGAVYGKDHDPVHEHIRTRPELSEPMTHLGPAAPAGLHCYRNWYRHWGFGTEFRDNLFACQFNLAKVSRHVLKPKGSTYETIDSDFVTSDNRDFHPTDVIEDTDGSLLIVDTGGWYKLCCPSSVMEKKDILGGIYRVKPETPLRLSGEDWKKHGESLLKPDLDRSGQPHTASFSHRIGPADFLVTFGYVSVVLDMLAEEKNDRVLDTALTRALIDIGDAKATAEGLKHESPRVKRAALAALDQMPGGNLKADDVIPNLDADDTDLRNTAWWIAGRHPEWGAKLTGYFAERLKVKLTQSDSSELAGRLAKFAGTAEVQRMIADAAGVQESAGVALRAMALARPKTVPPVWVEALTSALKSDRMTHQAVATVRTLPWPKGLPQPLADELARIAGDDTHSPLLQLSVLALTGAKSDDLFGFVLDHLKAEPPVLRGLAVEAVTNTKLTPDRLRQIVDVVPYTSPVDLAKLLEVFGKSTDESVGLALAKALAEPKVRAAIRTEQVKPILDRYPPAVHTEVAKLYEQLAADRAELTKKLDTLLSDTKPGDVRRGQAVFNSAKAACVSCHKVAYVGGLVGPDLTKIGSIRTEQDLLESIVFPSATFVRSYEPVKVTTHDGRAFSGILKSDTPDGLVLTVNATDEVRLARQDVDEVIPGTVSVMPAGLDQQLTPQELADLIAFLKTLK